METSSAWIGPHASTPKRTAYTRVQQAIIDRRDRPARVDPVEDCRPDNGYSDITSATFPLWTREHWYRFTRIGTIWSPLSAMNDA